MNKLNVAVDRIHELERERDRALDALEGMVEQHCGNVFQPGHVFHTAFILANEEAFEVLVDAGRMEPADHDHYRLVDEVAA